jgi:hypothetical protein
LLYEEAKRRVEMAEGTDQKITIDEVEYNLSDLSDNAKAQLANIQFVDAQILQLNNEWAVADTARMGYTNALKAELAKIGDDE